MYSSTIYVAMPHNVTNRKLTRVLDSERPIKVNIELSKKVYSSRINLLEDLIP